MNDRLDAEDALTTGATWSDHDVADWVRESTRRQGLPEKLEDPATIRRVAAALGAPGRRDEKEKPMT